MAVADFSPFHLFTFSLLLGWLLDLLLGDPSWLPHPVVGFGKVIAFGERHLNKGSHRKLKGALLAVSLIAATYGLILILLECLSFCRNDVMTLLREIICALIVFFCLAGTTLIREVREVFLALDRSLDEGRRQVARIVGRDTSELSSQEVRTAALETLAENLSDGVIAPLFWFMLLGAPGMLAYKMVNTLDSMIGYRTDRYRDFGCWAARIDDIANYIPARLTALLMIVPKLITINPRGGNTTFRFLLSSIGMVASTRRPTAAILRQLWLASLTADLEARTIILANSSTNLISERTTVRLQLLTCEPPSA